MTGQILACSSVWFLQLILCILVSAQCPTNFVNKIPETGSCLHYVTTARSWYDARDDCATFGAAIVKLDSAVIANVSQSVATANSGPNYWVGVNDILKTGEYRWPTGTLMTWSFWGSFTVTHPQPNDPNGSQGCVIGDLDANMLITNSWQDKPCHELHDYICQYFPGDDSIKTGYFQARQDDPSTLKNLDLTSTQTLPSKLACTAACVQDVMCDVYAYNSNTKDCFLLKLRENTSSEATDVRNAINGSETWIRNG